MDRTLLNIAQTCPPKLLTLSKTSDEKNKSIINKLNQLAVMIIYGL